MEQQNQIKRTDFNLPTRRNQTKPFKYKLKVLATYFKSENFKNKFGKRIDNFQKYVQARELALSLTILFSSINN